MQRRRGRRESGHPWRNLQGVTGAAVIRSQANAAAPDWFHAAPYPWAVRVSYPPDGLWGAIGGRSESRRRRMEENRLASIRCHSGRREAAVRAPAERSLRTGIRQGGGPSSPSAWVSVDRRSRRWTASRAPPRDRSRRDAGSRNAGFRDDGSGRGASLSCRSSRARHGPPEWRGSRRPAASDAHNVPTDPKHRHRQTTGGPPASGIRAIAIRKSPHTSAE